MEDKKAKKGGEKYIPFNERDSKESIVYFTRDLSSEGLKKIYEKINENIDGKVAISCIQENLMDQILFQENG